MLTEGAMNVLNVWVLSIMIDGLVFSTGFAADAAKGKAVPGTGRLPEKGQEPGPYYACVNSCLLFIDRLLTTFRFLFVCP